MANGNVFEEYFENNIKYRIPLREEISYCATIDKFYDECIKEHVEELYEKNEKNLIKWHDFIMTIANIDVPIYWVRKYESSTSYGRVIDEEGNIADKSGKKYNKSSKNKNGEDYNTRWNTRRGALTIVTNDRGEPQYGYVFVSNFDAHEIYNMVLNIEEPDSDTFTKMMRSGEYPLHYDKGGSCVESDIAYYKCTGSTRAGVMTAAKWYLAHINDVNGEYYDGDQNQKDIVKKLCPAGDENYTPGENVKWGVIKDWKKIGEWQKIYGDRYDSLFKDWEINDDARIRIIEKSSNTDFDKEKKLLKAHFLRFIHPFNYFLVPTPSYIFNAVIPRIGEYPSLINYARQKIAKICDEKNSLKDCLLEYYKEIMIKNPGIINNKSDNESANSKIMEHILYGQKLSVSKELSALEKKGFIVNNDDLFKFMSPYKREGTIYFNYYLDGEHLGEVPKKHGATTEVSIKYVVDALINKYNEKNVENYRDIDVDDTISINVTIKDIDEKQQKNKKNIIKQNHGKISQQMYKYNGLTGKISKIIGRVLEDYIKDNPHVTFAELSNEFNFFIGKNPFLILDDMKNKEKKHYIKKPIILNNGEEVFVFNGWPSGDKQKNDFFELTKKLGYVVEKV